MCHTWILINCVSAFNLLVGSRVFGKDAATWAAASPTLSTPSSPASPLSDGWYGVEVAAAPVVLEVSFPAVPGRKANNIVPDNAIVWIDFAR